MSWAPGPFEWVDDPDFRAEYANAVPRMDAAWREFREVVDEAQRTVK
jgi:hypothetical protein